MTMPSSTSQSVFSAPRGISTSSFGPMIALVGFMNRIGSAGIGMSASAAWTLIVQPHADDFAHVRHARPNARRSGDFRDFAASSELTLARLSGSNASPPMSETIADKSRSRPLSNNAGRSLPASPVRSSFTACSSFSVANRRDEIAYATRCAASADLRSGRIGGSHDSSGSTDRTT